MNDNHNEATDGEAKAKPEVIKLGLDLPAGYRVSATRRLNAKAAAEMGSVEVAESSRRVG
jgi:hypothetical protein